MLPSRIVARRAAVASLGLVLAAVAVAVGQVKTTVPDVVARRPPDGRRAHHDSRKGARGQPRGRRRRPRRHRLPASELRAEPHPPLSGRLRPAWLLDRRGAVDDRRSTCRRRSRGRSRKGAHEMIVVLPDSKTVHNGSMYSSSVTTGDFEQLRRARRRVVHRRALPDDPRAGRAAASSATPWAATAPRASA